MRRAALNLILAVGFLAVIAAIILARTSPAGPYEASIYTGTPIGTWAALAVAFAVAVATTLSTRGRPQALGIALGGLSVTTIISLPALRNYRFAGMGDALTHLGWTRDFLAGSMYPHELFYPALHSISATFTLLGGVPLERAMMLSVVALFIPFLLFVPLVVRDITGSGLAVAFAAIVSWFILPINNVATHMGAHTNSNALFLVPAVLFVFVAYMRRQSGPARLPFGISPFSLLLIVAGAGLLLVHPQQMINVVVVFGAVSGIQLLSRWWQSDHPMGEHTAAYAHTAILGGLFLIWAASNARFRRAFSGLVSGIFAQDIGAGSEVGQRGGSLTEIGGSLGELFVKMFLVSAVVGTVVALFILLTWIGRTRVDGETKSFITYFAVALFPLGAMFVVYAVGTPTMAFRQVGFIYVLLTILAGVALGHGFGWLGNVITTPGSTTVAASLVGVCLVLSLLTAFGSPFIYNPTQHVSDGTYHGYNSAFTHAEEDVPLAGFGFGVTRYSHGIDGVEVEERGYAAGPDAVVDPEAFNRGAYPEAYPPDNYYFIVTSYDETRELEIYGQLHHDRAALEGIESHQGTNRVLTNGDFRLYTVSERR